MAGSWLNFAKQVNGPQFLLSHSTRVLYPTVSIGTGILESLQHREIPRQYLISTSISVVWIQEMWEMNGIWKWQETISFRDQWSTLPLMPKPHGQLESISQILAVQLHSKPDSNSTFYTLIRVMHWSHGYTLTDECRHSDSAKDLCLWYNDCRSIWFILEVSSEPYLNGATQAWHHDWLHVEGLQFCALSKDELK